MKAISKGSGEPAYYLRIPMRWHDTAAFPAQIENEEYTLETPAGSLKFERPFPGIARIQAGPYSSDEEARAAYDLLLSYFTVAQVGHELFTYIPWQLQELGDASELLRLPPGRNPWAPKWPAVPTSLKRAFSDLAHVIPDHEHVIEQEVLRGGRILQDLPLIIQKLDGAARQLVSKPPERARALAFFFSEARAATKLAGIGSLVQVMRFQNDISLLEALAPALPVSQATSDLITKLLQQIPTENDPTKNGDIDAQYLRGILERARKRSIGRSLRHLMNNLLTFDSPSPQFLEHFKNRNAASNLITDAYDFRSTWTHEMEIPAEHVADGTWEVATITARTAATEALRQYVLGYDVTAAG